MRRGLSGIDIYQPRDNGLPDFANITPAQIFNGSAAASANAMEQEVKYARPRPTTGMIIAEGIGGTLSSVVNAYSGQAGGGDYGGGYGGGYGGWGGGGGSVFEGAMGAAQRHSGGNFWNGAFNSAMEGARDGLYGGSRARYDGRRYTRIPGTGNIMEARKARVVPEYINGKASYDRGHRKINQGSPNRSFESPPPPPLPQQIPHDLPSSSGLAQPLDNSLVTPPQWYSPIDPASGYVPTDPNSANSIPPGAMYSQPAAAEMRTRGIPPGGYAPPDYDDNTDNLNPNLFSPDYNEDESLFPPPDAIQMRTGAVNRLPTRLLEELQELYRV